ncbi:MAG TPA: hypothetical protein VK190_06780 [Pseudoneobacillus sp.]|nr:hypothetical protein [Pseudoneobacillus sp.]
MEFILQNPIFLLVIIVGIIRALYKKSKGINTANSSQESEWKRRKQFPRTFYESSPEATRAPLEQSSNRRKFIQDYEEIKKNTAKDQIITQTNDRKDSSLQRKDTLKKDVFKSDMVDLDISPSKQNVIDGVVWAEIIGPPRALRPHLQRKSTYRR